MYKPYEQYLLALNNGDKYRRLASIRQEGTSGFLDFSTNDYLSLSQRSDIIEAGAIYGRSYGTGSTGSRLLSGNLPLFEEFETRIAQDKNSEASLIFCSGFQANISVLSSLLDEKILSVKPLVFFDKLNHSSLYQAVFLSKAELCRYHHNDMNHLEYLLIKHLDDDRPKFIVTETVFGMDGDFAPLENIIELARRHNAFLYLDEAHATGVFGMNGYGISTMFKLQDIPHLIMGTFSKAIGVSGGYVASHQILKDFLINKATGFIYSTAPSPMVIGAAFEAWKIVKSLDKERQYLQNLGGKLRNMLIDYGFNIGTSQTHIIPIILGEEKLCLQAQEFLLKEKIITSCIRPPTVPPKSARLRIALTSKHLLTDVKKFVEILKKTISDKKF